MAVRDTIDERWQKLSYDLMAGDRLSDADVQWLIGWFGHQHDVADDHDDVRHMRWCCGWQSILLERLAAWEKQDKLKERGL